MSATQTQVGGSHYRDMKIQPVDFIHANGIGYMEGCAIKYLCRHRAKGGRQDLEKAKHYIELLIQKEYSGESIATGVEQYRFLGANDVIESGDEFFDTVRREWAVSEEVGKKVSTFPLQYRRKVTHV